MPHLPVQTPVDADGTEPTARSFASQGLMLNYWDWGNRGAPPLVLVHGTCDHARSWDWTARCLRDDYRVVALDLRGHGDSDWSPDGAYLLAYHVVDLTNLIDTLGGDPITIVAHSFGGAVASRFAAAFPDRTAKLVLVDGFGPSSESYAKWVEVGPVRREREWIGRRRNQPTKAPRRLASIEEGATRMAVRNPRLSAAQAHHLAKHGLRAHPDGFGWKFDPRVTQFTSEDFAIDITDFWREITAPTLLYRGTESFSHDPEATGAAAHLRDHRSIAVEKAAHWPHHDRFESFLAALLDFL